MLFSIPQDARASRLSPWILIPLIVVTLVIFAMG